MAKVLGVSNATVARVWKACGIRPGKKAAKSTKARGLSKMVSELLGVYVIRPVTVLVLGVGRSASQADPGAQTLVPAYTAEAMPSCNGSAIPGCGSCLSAALALLDRSAMGLPEDHRANLNGLLPFLETALQGKPRDSDLHVLLEGPGRAVVSAVHEWARRRPHVRVHLLDSGSLRRDDVQDVVDGITGAEPVQGFAHSTSAIVSALDRFVRTADGGPTPFVWTRDHSHVPENGDICKVVLETMRHLGSLIAVALHLHVGTLQGIRTTGEDPMNLRQKLESWFAAIAFAEEGEHETALKIAATPIPDVGEAPAILPSFSNAFAAAAFAEENCPEMASEILYGVRRRNLFLETIGLAKVRVWLGTASAEPLFAEAVGLMGVRFRVMSLRL
jgi:hypothetical protein